MNSRRNLFGLMAVWTPLIFLSALPPAHGQQGFLDFEDAPSYGGDDAIITDDYFARRGFSFSAQAGSSASDAEDVVFSFEKTGRDGTDGFWTKGQAVKDEALSGDLGNYFMKAGTGHMDYKKSKYFKMTIDYQTLSDGANGEIWDIDGPEQYKVTAYDQKGSEIGTLLSPEGGLNAEPWLWSFDASSDDTKISSIDIEAVGTGKLRGFAFDNFDAWSAALPEALAAANGAASVSAASHAAPAAFAAPLPPALPIGCAGVCGIALYNRWRHRRKAPVAAETS